MELKNLHNKDEPKVEVDEQLGCFKIRIKREHKDQKGTIGVSMPFSSIDSYGYEEFTVDKNSFLQMCAKALRKEL